MSAVILIVPPDVRDLALCIGACLAFALLAVSVKGLAGCGASQHE